MATKKQVLENNMKYIDKHCKGMEKIDVDYLKYIVKGNWKVLNKLEKDIIGLLEHLGLKALNFAENEIIRLKTELKAKIEEE